MGTSVTATFVYTLFSFTAGSKYFSTKVLTYLSVTAWNSVSLLNRFTILSFFYFSSLDGVHN